MTLSPVSRLGVIGTFVFYHNKSSFPWKPKTDKGACKAIKKKKILKIRFCVLYFCQSKLNKQTFVSFCYKFFTKEIPQKVLLKSTSVKENHKLSYSQG